MCVTIILSVSLTSAIVLLSDLFFFNFCKDLFISYVHRVQPPCTPASQKRATALITDGCEPQCRCWELNSGPPEEKSVLLTSESSLQPYSQIFMQSLFIKIQSKCHYTTPHTVLKISIKCRYLFIFFVMASFFLFFTNVTLVFIYISVFRMFVLYVYLCTHIRPNERGGQELVSAHLELDLQSAVNFFKY